MIFLHKSPHNSVCLSVFDCIFKLGNKDCISYNDFHLSYTRDLLHIKKIGGLIMVVGVYFGSPVSQSTSYDVPLEESWPPHGMGMG
jgi:hypothetical protein